MKRRVVVTGMGCITPCGLNVEDTWKSVESGKSGIVKLRTIDPDAQLVKIGGQVPEYNPEDYVDG